MELRDYLTALRRRRWVIIAVTVIVAGTTLFLSLLQEPVYEARTKVLIERDTTVFESSSAQIGADYVETQLEVIKSEPVGTIVKDQLGLSEAPSVSTSAIGTTSVVEMRAESTDPQKAAAIANAYADAYLTYRRQRTNDSLAAERREVQARVDAIQKQIDDVGNELNGLPPCSTSGPAISPACSQRESLLKDRDALVSQQVPFKQRLDELQVNASVDTSGAHVVAPAAAPEEPVRPRPVRNTVFGLGVGLLFGMMLAYLFEHLDDSISGKDDLERATGDLPVLAMIPAIAGWKDREGTRVVALTEPSSPTAEAYRTLRTSIRFLAVERPLRTIQLTSPTAGEGKTTTTANLAVVLARAGERVVIVSCDLRRPRLHEFFGLSNNVGFTSVLLGEAPLSAALQRVNPDDDRLWLLASGPLPPNPSELLSSVRAGEVLTGLEGYADTVLIDCPPVLPVTDAAVLSAKVDGTLIVVSAGSTTSKQLSRTVEVLRQVGAPLVGTILNNAPAESAYGYAYGYYYTSESALKRSRSETVGAGNGQTGSEKRNAMRIAERAATDGRSLPTPTPGSDEP